VRRVSQSNYRADPHYPRVVRAVNEILASGGNVAPVEVFVRMGLLARQDVEDWQSGRVPYSDHSIQLRGKRGPSNPVEVTNGQSSAQTVWQMTVASGGAYRSYRLPSLYPGVIW
jgi:hypothetical protein